MEKGILLAAWATLCTPHGAEKFLPGRDISAAMVAGRRRGREKEGAREINSGPGAISRGWYRYSSRRVCNDGNNTDNNNNNRGNVGRSTAKQKRQVNRLRQHLRL